MSTLIHINQPRGWYLGQVRDFGGKRWATITGKCRSPQAALQKAVGRLQAHREHYRARVIFVDSSGWYEPHVVMSAKWGD